MNSKLKISLIFIIFFYLAIQIIPPPELYPNTKNSKALFDRNNKLLALSISSDQQYRLITKLDDISEDLIKATLLYEDKYFYYHLGFNPVSLVKGALASFLNPNQLVGGSTITMQLVRLQKKLYTRSVLGKLKQIYYAVLLELFYSKKQILEAYLNLAPYGANIQGIDSASLVYFRKKSKELTLDEAITLAVIPQNPALRWKPTGQADLQKAGDELIRRWQENYAENAQVVDLKYSPADVPLNAVHLLNRLSKKSSASHFDSNINSDLQKITEESLNSILKRYADFGINNGAVMLAELPTMQVRAYVGSAQYTNSGINGFVNGLTAKRSPGSLLKPFIYGLALDQGIIIPQTMLTDIPIRLSAYQPQNFEKNFLGPISAVDALIRSRNIPALELYRKLTPSSFYDFLKQAGVKKLKNEDHYGIALVLGGLGTSAEEVARLYGILGSGGQSLELQFLQDKDDLHVAEQLLSAESAFLVKSMLSENPPALARLKSAKIPWKTGTSYGSKDAWSAGLIGKYVLVVWLGNFNGQANPNLVGRDMAGPLFFTIADRILASGIDTFLPEHKLLNLKTLEVCALSGALPSKHCKHRKSSQFIPGVSPINTCTLHQEIHINPKTGLRLCQGDHGGITKVYEVWDSETQKVFEKAGLKRSLPPAYESTCGMTNANSYEIRIISPEEHLEYFIFNNQELELEFLATTSGDSKKISWFVDNQFVGQVQSGKSFFWKSKAGKYIVRAVDELGRSKSVGLRVVQQAG